MGELLAVKLEQQKETSYLGPAVLKMKMKPTPLATSLSLDNIVAKQYFIQS